MKKLKLSELPIGSAEVLTREDLKNVLGGGVGHGTEIGSRGDKCNSKCSSDADCDSTCSICDKDAANHGAGFKMCVATA